MYVYMSIHLYNEEKYYNTKKLLRVILRNNLHRYLSVYKTKVSGWVRKSRLVELRGVISK